MKEFSISELDNLSKKFIQLKDTVYGRIVPLKIISFKQKD